MWLQFMSVKRSEMFQVSPSILQNSKDETFADYNFKDFGKNIETNSLDRHREGRKLGKENLWLGKFSKSLQKMIFLWSNVF